MHILYNGRYTCISNGDRRIEKKNAEESYRVNFMVCIIFTIVCFTQREWREEYKDTVLTKYRTISTRTSIINPNGPSRIDWIPGLLLVSSAMLKSCLHPASAWFATQVQTNAKVRPVIKALEFMVALDIAFSENESRGKKWKKKESVYA